MFCNSKMRFVKKTKPHIALIWGYWRVSAMPKPYHKYMDVFQEAHAFTYKLNAERRAQQSA